MEWGLAHISSRELSEWAAFDAQEPIGERRVDLLVAYLMSLIANVNRGKDQKAFEVKDFLLDFWPEQKRESGQSLEEQRAILEMMRMVFERPPTADR